MNPSYAPIDYINPNHVLCQKYQKYCQMINVVEKKYQIKFSTALNFDPSGEKNTVRVPHQLKEKMMVPNNHVSM